MTIKQLQETIEKACNEFSRDNKIGVKEIDLHRIIELGNQVPLDYKIEIKVF